MKQIKLLKTSFALMFTFMAFLALAVFCGGAIAETLTIPRDTTIIEDYAFAGCDAFTGRLEIPDGVIRIGAHAFDGCTGLTGDVILPESVEYIGESAFENTELRVLTWEDYLSFYRYEENDDGIAITDVYTFGETYDFHNIPIPHEIDSFTVTEIGNNAFYYLDEMLSGDLVIPESVKRIGKSAFYRAPKLTGRLYLPSGLERIDSFAFQGCGFSDISPLPESLSYIGDSVFFDCSNLSGDIAIPTSVVYCGSNVFGNTQVREVWSHWALAWEISDGGAIITRFHGNIKGTVTLPETLDGYNVVKIGDDNKNLLYDWNNLNSASIEGTLVLPRYTKAIGASAFTYCDGEFLNGAYGLLSGNVVLPEQLETIGESAFYQCRITGINIPTGLRNIKKRAFMRCYYLNADLAFPEGLTKIDKEAFNECLSLTGTLTLPESLTEIESFAFYRVPLNGQLVLPSNLETIGRNAFGLTGLMGISALPDSLKTIGDYAFHCAAFISDGEIRLPASVEYVGKDAFTSYWGELVPVYLEGSSPGIKWLIERDEYYDYTDCSIKSGYMVVGCNNVETDNVVLPTTYMGEPVVGVGFCGLTGCDKLKGQLVIPEGYLFLDNQAFGGCTGLTGVPVLPSTMQRIFVAAFGGCSGLSGELVLSEGIRLEGAAFNDTNLTVYQGGELIYQPNTGE